MKLQALLDRIDENKKWISDRRPLSTQELRELDNYYRVGTTYSSNALEGNSLTLSETKVLLEDGITVGGKPIRDFYEANGHAKAYDFMLEIARGGDIIYTEDIIKKLHHLFYNGIDEASAGKYRGHQVIITGTEYLPPAPEKVPALMATFASELNEQKNKLHPLLFAAFAHRRLVDIHPFADGNGRTARLLMNLVLVNKGYCVLSIPPVMRNEYIGALITAQRSEKSSEVPFQTLIAECELEAQRDYGRLFNIPLPKPNKIKSEPER